MYVEQKVDISIEFGVHGTLQGMSNDLINSSHTGWHPLHFKKALPLSLRTSAHLQYNTQPVLLKLYTTSKYNTLTHKHSAVIPNLCMQLSGVINARS